MKRHQELVALRIRAERATVEAQKLRARVADLEDRLAQAIAAPSRDHAELVDLTVALAEWERLPLWRRFWTSPKRLLALGAP